MSRFPAYNFFHFPSTLIIFLNTITTGLKKKTLVGKGRARAVHLANKLQMNYFLLSGLTFPLYSTKKEGSGDLWVVREISGRHVR